MSAGVVGVIDYGIGNLRSAYKALQHVGADVRLITDPALVDEVDGVVLPGVGAFGPTMDALEGLGFDRSILGFIDSGRPFLGICVGMQVLYQGSEESPGRPGLGVLDGTVKRLPRSVIVPQMQWNQLAVASAADDDGPSILAGLGDEPWMYFVHSYAADVGPSTIATCEYGGSFAAAVRQGNVSATQFHPEKSGPTGLRVLTNFVDQLTAAK